MSHHDILRVPGQFPILDRIDAQHAAAERRRLAGITLPNPLLAPSEPTDLLQLLAIGDQR